MIYTENYCIRAMEGHRTGVAALSRTERTRVFLLQGPGRYLGVGIVIALVFFLFVGLGVNPPLMALAADGGEAVTAEVRVELDAFALEAALEREESVTLPFYGGHRTMFLKKVEIYAPGAQLVLETGKGDETYPLESGSYQGAYRSGNGHDGSVTLTVHAPFLSAMLRGEGFKEWIRTEYEDSQAVYYTGGLSFASIATPNLFVMPALAVSEVGADTPPRQFAHGTYNCYEDEPFPIIGWDDIVPHADYSYYNFKGNSATAVRNTVEADVNNVNGIYNEETCTGFRILAILIHTCAHCDVLTSTHAPTLIDQFQGHFEGIHDPYYYFDIAHLWTGKNLQGGTIGIANQIGGRYALSQQVNEPGSYYDAGSYDRMLLIAHEIGHDYDAIHPNARQHSCWWEWFWQWCDYSIMWATWQRYMLDDFSDANTALIQNERPKPNI